MFSFESYKVDRPSLHCPIPEMPCISYDELNPSKILEHFGFGRTDKIYRPTCGASRDVYIVESNTNERYVLRLEKSLGSFSLPIENEISVLTRLASQSDLATPRPLAVVVQPHSNIACGFLSTFIEGIDGLEVMKSNSANFAFVYGAIAKLLWKLHSYSDIIAPLSPGSHIPNFSYRFCVNTIKNAWCRFNIKRVSVEAIQKAFEMAISRMPPFLLDFVWCHNDPKPCNSIFSISSNLCPTPVGLIDFQCCNLAPRFVDLCSVGLQPLARQIHLDPEAFGGFEADSPNSPPSNELIDSFIFNALFRSYLPTENVHWINEDTAIIGSIIGHSNSLLRLDSTVNFPQFIPKHVELIGQLAKALIEKG